MYDICVMEEKLPLPYKTINNYMYSLLLTTVCYLLLLIFSFFLNVTHRKSQIRFTRKFVKYK